MWDWFAKYWLETLFGIIVAGLSGAYAKLAQKFKVERAKNLAIENGLREMMRVQILDIYDQCIHQDNKISISKKDAVDSLFKSYVALGGDNGTVQNIHDLIMHMEILTQ